MSSGAGHSDDVGSTPAPETQGPTVKLPAAEGEAPQDQDPQDQEPLPGTPYLPIEVLGEGASGQVLRAKHMDLDSQVVVKLLHFRVDAAPELADRMRLEAQALARLSHPNLVDVIDYGVSDGHPYFVMEDLGGRALDEELHERGALPVAEAVELGCQMLAGLHYVHEQGLVHRDVKPSNLLLTTGRDGKTVVKLIDFGVLKIVGAAGDHQLTPLASPTEVGTSLGTPRYLSPEQAKGGGVGPRTDIYSAGMVIYEMMCGRSPFAHHNDMAKLLMAQVLEKPQPPSTHAAQHINAALDVAIMRAVEKEPSARPASAAAFAADLRSALATPDAPEPSTIPRQGRQATEAMAMTAPEQLGVAPTAMMDEGAVASALASSRQHAAQRAQEAPAAAAQAPMAHPPASTPTPMAFPSQPEAAATKGRSALGLLVASAAGFMLLTVLVLALLKRSGVLP